MDSTTIGSYLDNVKATAASIERKDIIKRIWQKDPTVWKPEPTEITNRLGWLNVIRWIHQQVPDLKSFADEVRQAGFNHVVLLGMGGSSLGAEVLWQTFGNKAGYPELIVLDSTIPARIHTVSNTIDPAHTLFIVSSKSGSTILRILLHDLLRSGQELPIGYWILQVQ